MFVIYKTAPPEQRLVSGWVVSPDGAPAPTLATDYAAGPVTSAELDQITGLIDAGYHFGPPLQPYKPYFEAYYEASNPFGERLLIAIMGGGVPPVASDLAITARLRRDTLLTDTDFTQQANLPISAGLRAEFVTYRQALRDVPQQGGFPLTITWPVAPTYAKL